MKSKLKNGIVASALCTAVALVAPAGASAATTCTFDDATNTVTVSATGAELSFVTLERDLAEINVNNDTCLDGGVAATVNNTDKIEISNAANTETRVSIDQDGGTFAPGATAEAGADEIEMDVDLTGDEQSDMFIHAVSGNRHIRAGTVAGGVGFNLNADDELLNADSDVTVDGIDGGRAINVFGTTGADTLSAAGGAGFTGPMTSRIHLIGLNGNDTLTGGNGDDLIEPDNHDDTVNAGPGFDHVISTSGNDTLNGNSGEDRISYSNSSAAVNVDLGKAGQQNTGGAGLDTLSGFETLEGSNHGDVLTGNDGDNFLDANGGNDLLIGRGGDDGLQGGPGVNTASYARPPAGVNTGVTVNLDLGGAQETGHGKDTLIGIRNLTGSPFADKLTGDEQANRFEIRDGIRDQVTCGADADTVIADQQGVDLLTAGCESVSFAPKPPVVAKPSPGAAANPAPVVSKASVSPRRLKAVRRGSRGAKSRRAALRYTLSEKASVRVAIIRKGKKRRTTTLKQKGKAGRNRIRFGAKVGKRALKPGRYRAVIVATDASGKRSKPVTVTFRVTRR